MERRVCSEARTGGGLGSFLYVWVFFTPFLFVFHRFSPTFQSFSQLYQVLQGAGWGGGVGVCVCVCGGGVYIQVGLHSDFYGIWQIYSTANANCYMVGLDCRIQPVYTNLCCL